MIAVGIGVARYEEEKYDAANAAAGALDTAFPIIGFGDEPLVKALLSAAAQPSENTTIVADSTRLLEALSSSPAQAEIVRRLARVADDAPGNRRRRIVVSVLKDLAVAPASVPDVYLRLHLLSSRRVRPNTISLEGVFGILPNLVWTANGPYTLEEFEQVRLDTMVGGIVPEIRAVDKFPRLVDYIIPSGVRIADPSRVRLGAYLGEGTTIMHEGFVNYNAGTLGKAMVEGRISQGVIVGNGSDIGGGASIMGTLSGGGNVVISVGEDCLISANSGLGISLGNRCTVEAGLYLTSGTKVLLEDGTVVKARALSGQDDLLFWRNSQTGAVEMHPKSNSVRLNAALHA